MNVGLYNRWLATLGGGEKLGLSVAEYISQFYPVTVISHKPVSKDLAAERLSLDLSRVDFNFIPERLATDISPITSDYDFFITASFLDYFPCRSPKSALLIYFPSPIDVEPVMYLRRKFKFALRRWLMVPSFHTGVYNIESGPKFQIRWLTNSLQVRLPPLSRDTNCSFDLASKDRLIRQVTVSLDGEQIGEIQLPNDNNYKHFSFSLPQAINNLPRELAIHIPDRKKPTSPDEVKLLLANFQIDHPRYRLYQLVFERWLKQYGMRLHYVPPGLFSIIESVDTYSSIWAISNFSQKWIRKYWDRPSEILFPPINIEDFHPGKKRQQILSVGRFFTGSHNKKHLEMVAAFKNMVDDGLQGWELHLAGGSTPGIEHSDYLKKIKRESIGYPIILHIDIAFEELVKLYSESAIYWHSSGYGEDENREPIKFEHFGITTVEAMASGCVPVVLGKGGQPEIVQHARNGFNWQSLSELKKYTEYLINNPARRNELSTSAIETSKKYDKSSFNDQLGKLLKKIDVL